MLSISHLKLRNFKSFKNLNVDVPRSTVCFAGPNGSGKSNVCDSIRFVLGETSLKSLRAKRVKDLIHMGSKAAEVTIALGGDDNYEIKRAIREDGKILYRMNGKKVTRMAIMEALKKYNLDSSGRNIIAQGEVQRIARIGGKERRQIIDSVAGISDFEEKKKEALRDLEVVEGRINDANIVLGERISFLDELGRERNIALRYKDAKERLDSARATLIDIEVQRYEKELSKFEEQKKKITEKIENAQGELENIKVEIKKTEEERLGLSKELQKKQKSAEEIRRIEELKAKVSSLEQKVKDKTALIEELGKEKAELEKEIKEKKAKVGNLIGEIDEMEKELKKTEPLVKEGKTEELDDLLKTRESKTAIEKELQSLREKNAGNDAEISGKNGHLDLLKKQLEEFSEDEEEPGDIEKKIDELKKEKNEVDGQIEEMFTETRETNKEISELEKKLLELKEKTSIYRVRSSPHLMNPAIRAIDEMKKKNDGIHGTVADLIQFDPSLSKAIEAAAGSRLLYVVVDRADRAVKIIEQLKKERVGRATFIPLDVIKSQEAEPNNGFEPILRKISCSPRVKKAVEYVFGDTLLVNGHADAKKVGVGKARMVTTDGAIYERSGIIAGGHVETGILAQKHLKKLEDEFSSVKDEKDALTKRLYEIREEESELRASRSRLDIEIKSLEAEIQSTKSEILERQKKKKGIQDALSKITDELDKLGSERKELHDKMAKLSKELETAEKELSAKEQETREKQDMKTKQATELAEKVSSLKATIGGRRRELEVIQDALKENEDDSERIGRETKKVDAEIRESSKEIQLKSKELSEEEEKMKTKGKKIEELFENMGRLETELQKWGGEQDRIRREISDLEKELSQHEIKGVSSSTRLEDLKTEFEKYRNVKPLEEKSKQKLNEMINESEQTVNEIGSNVNLAAIEMYARKEEEIGEVKQKIDQLSDERNAIIKMIDEIEERKKEAFFEAFEKISDSFKKMFTYINIGEGYLMMDKPNSPFESGMYIRIKKDGHDYSMDSLSGGETTLVSLMFIFALQMYKPSPFYILDEVDAALDKENSKRMIQLIREMSKQSQFVIVSHNDAVISKADVVFGVTKKDNASRLVGVKMDAIAVPEK